MKENPIPENRGPTSDFEPPRTPAAQDAKGTAGGTVAGRSESRTSPKPPEAGSVEHVAERTREQGSGLSGIQPDPGPTERAPLRRTFSEMLALGSGAGAVTDSRALMAARGQSGYPRVWAPLPANDRTVHSEVSATDSRMPPPIWNGDLPKTPPHFGAQSGDVETAVTEVELGSEADGSAGQVGPDPGSGHGSPFEPPSGFGPEALQIGTPMKSRGQSRARSAKTEAEYEKRVQQLYRRGWKKRARFYEDAVILSPADIVGDLIEARDQYAPQSWVLYRAALLWHLASNRHGPSASAFDSAYRLLAATSNNQARDLQRVHEGIQRTQQPTKKTIPAADLTRLTSQLADMNRWGALTSHWLLAGLASGARPGEWLNATWSDETESSLCLPNSKRKVAVPVFTMVGAGETIHDLEADSPERLIAGAASDDRKRIRIVPIAQGDRPHVSSHLKAMNDYLDEKPGISREDRFVSYFNMCRKTLRSACLKAFNGRRSYSLYAMRSQFAANMKAKLPLAEVAELMGHIEGSRVTMANYGGRWAAHGGHENFAPVERQRVAQLRAGSKARRVKADRER